MYEQKCPVVIMAGGKGSRLRPISDVIPKPLLPIEGKPITHLIMDRFMQQGVVESFFLLLCHSADLIETYFTTRYKSYAVTCIREEEPMGTAGGLRTLSDRLHGTFIMTCCDALIDVDIPTVLRQHHEQRNLVTLVGARNRVEIPYGVIETESDGNVCNIREKPSVEYIANVGLYVCEREILDYLQASDVYIDMPQVVDMILGNKKKVGIVEIDTSAFNDFGDIVKFLSLYRY